MELNDEIERLDADIVTGEEELEQTKVNLLAAKKPVCEWRGIYPHTRGMGSRPGQKYAPKQ